MTEVAGVPLLPSVLARVKISTLELTEPGDVFYLAADPGTVWFRDKPDGGYDGYTFTPLAKESWCTQGEVGNGTPGQRVVVLHNTIKFGVRRPKGAD